MTAPAKSATSVLASLTAEVMADKVGANKRALTPVAGEGRPPVKAALPNDTGLFLSNETLREHAVQLRKFAADALTIADGIDALVTSDTLPPSAEADAKPDSAAEQKQKEFEADLRAKERAAQAATFGDDTENEDPPESNAIAIAVEDGELKITDLPAGWVCPEHGKAVMKTSTKGREYRGCPDCKLFER